MNVINFYIKDIHKYLYGSLGSSLNIYLYSYAHLKEAELIKIYEVLQTII